MVCTQIVRIEGRHEMIPNVDMWVCATGARHSKSLERRGQRTACLRGFTLMCTFLVKAEWWMSNVDMWVGTRSAWHSKSLERRCQTAVRMFPGCYYTRCALIRTDGRLYTCSSD